MINVKHLRDLVIIPVLEHLNMCSKSAINLSLGTCAVESNMGYYLKQHPIGPAIGIYQMEPFTHDSIWDDFIKYNSKIKIAMFDFADSKPLATKLIGDLHYATAMMRLKYYWSPKALPRCDDIEAMAWFWRTEYNGSSKVMTDQQAISKFKRKYHVFVEDKL